MTCLRRRIRRRAAAVFSAWLAAMLWLATIPPAQAGPEGVLRLDDGAELHWSLSETADFRPELAFAIPSHVEWKTGGLIEPVQIALHTNYAAFIEQWELSLFRESDARRRYPVAVWSGPGASLASGLEWDGTPQTGPPLRPGETLVAQLRARDTAGNIDETEPQTALITRYLMKVERKRHEAIDKVRRSALHDRAPAAQAIPISGQLLTVRVTGHESENPLHLSSLALRDEGGGTWSQSQIVPPGVYGLKAQTARPIMGGARLVSIGKLPLAVHAESDLYVKVRGAGALQRSPHDIAVEGLRPDGMLKGRDAVRLGLWDEDSSEARFAVAMIDPRRPVLLYKDERGRSVLRIAPPHRDAPWGGTAAGVAPKSVEVRIRYPAAAHQRLTLPHTDIDRERFRLSLRGQGGRVSYLSAGTHYTVDPAQGRVRITDAGRGRILSRLSGEKSTMIEATYRIRPSFAGLAREHPNGRVRVVEGNGDALAVDYGGGLPPDEAMLVSVGTEEPVIAEERGWVSRNFGWLIGG